MTLRELIDTLTTLPSDAPVVFDHGTMPTELCSWRGAYEDLTLDSQTTAPERTVAALLEDARAAVGGEFTGYKGGDYLMTEGTAVWADPWGEYHGRMLLGAKLSGGTVVLQTLVKPSEYHW